MRNNGVNSDWHTDRYAVKCPHRCPSPIISLQKSKKTGQRLKPRPVNNARTDKLDSFK